MKFHQNAIFSNFLVEIWLGANHPAGKCNKLLEPNRIPHFTPGSPAQPSPARHKNTRKPTLPWNYCQVLYHKKKKCQFIDLI